MESTSPPTTIANKLLHILKIAYYMIRKGISKRKLMMDLHLLLKRGKLAGKIISNLIHHRHGHHQGSWSGHTASSFSCRSMDPETSFYNPREVEFSCSNTPAYPSLRRKARKNYYCDYEAVAAIAKAFEMMSSGEGSDAEQCSVAPSPMIGFGKSPRVVRQLRITDSPFPIKEEEVADGKVDREAEEFIRRFYEQLRVQQRAAVVTPEYRFRRG